MYPAKGANDSFKNFDNMSNGGPGNSLSPLGYVDGQGSPAKSGAGGQGQRGGRLLEPLFGQNRTTTSKQFTKSGGMSAMTQHDGEADS